MSPNALRESFHAALLERGAYGQIVDEAMLEWWAQIDGRLDGERTRGGTGVFAFKTRRDVRPGTDYPHAVAERMVPDAELAASDLLPLADRVALELEAQIERAVAEARNV